MLRRPYRPTDPRKWGGPEGRKIYQLGSRRSLTNARMQQVRQFAGHAAPCFLRGLRTRGVILKYIRCVTISQVYLTSGRESRRKEP